MENFLLTNVEYYGFGLILFNLFLACALGFMISGIYILLHTKDTLTLQHLFIH